MIAVVPAVFAALANALASVFQRRAARDAPKRHALRPALLWDLMRRPVWLGGIGCMIAGFVLQATALTLGGLALVQPVLAAELPFTMLFAAWLNHAALGRSGWLAIAPMTGGLAVLLIGAAPVAGNRTPGVVIWLIVGAASGAAVGALLAVGRLLRGPVRAVAFGVTAGIGFAVTAALMKAAMQHIQRGLPALFTSWQLYVMAACGACSLFLLQNALQSGTLAAAQPALTISDPVASIALGVAIFGERIRTGWWLIAEIAGVCLIVYGSVQLSSTSAWQDHHTRKEQSDAPDPPQTSPAESPTRSCGATLESDLP